MSEHKYKDAYNKGYEKGKQEAFSGYCMSCYDELSLYEQAKLMVEWGADIPNVLDRIRAEILDLPKTYPFVNHFDDYVKTSDVLQIIDRHKAERE